MGVSWVLLYDWLGYVALFLLSGHMAIVCPQRYNSSFAPHQTTHHVGLMHSSSKRHFLWLFYIYTGATHHMTSNPAAFVSSSPYQGKSVVFTGDHTPLSISDIGTISLSSRSVLAMFFISMMLCWFLKSVSQNIFSVGPLCDDRQSYAILTPTSSVLSRIYTRIMS